MPTLRNNFLFLLIAAALAAATETGAAELSNLDAGLPTAIDDALAAAPGRFERLRALSPDEERRNRCRVIAGYSQLVAPSVVVVLDCIRESQERREHATNIAEAGLRYQFTDAITLGAGAGFGVGRDLPRFRAIASIQIGFGRWWRPWLHEAVA